MAIKTYLLVCGGTGCVASHAVELYDALFARTPAGWGYYLLWRLKIALRARMKTIAEARAKSGKAG